MNQGNMRERVIIKGYTVTKSATGADIKTETTIATVWANIKPVRGGESQDVGRLAAMQTYLVKIYKRDIDTSNFIVWGAKEMQIRSISDRWEQEKETPGQFLILECEYGAQV